MIQTPNKEKTIRVLLVEDNQSDVFLIKDNLKEFTFPVQMCVASDGEAALAALRRSLCFSAKQDPDFILLDLSLPKMNGHEVLAEIKNDPGLRHIPVLVLTGSTNENDRDAAYKSNAGFLLKPSQMEQYPSVVKSIEEFWLKNQR